MKAIRQVLVVGGGTAGWLAANHLAKTLNSKNPASVQVTLIESPDIPTIGVGEGTVPSLRQTLKYLGISETQLIRECDATFKQSVQFIDWRQSSNKNSQQHSQQQARDAYYHLFDFPEIQNLDPTAYWLLSKDESAKLDSVKNKSTQSELAKKSNWPKDYADCVSVQAHLCDLGLAPKQMLNAEFMGEVNYAYHFDAAKFALLLAQHAQQHLGVKHVKANMQEVILDQAGFIEKIKTDQGELAADFFVDCTGFSAQLIEKKLGVPLIDQTHCLFADSAIALQQPYEGSNSPIACYTQATAMDAGWIWDIGLQTRRGIGYVYSSRYTDQNTAEKKLRIYANDLEGKLNLRKIPMRVGYREKPWVGNCVAIGLSQGFVEPLEATGLLVYDVTARMLAELLPVHFNQLTQAADQFNEVAIKAWRKVIDFVKLHYAISKRDDSEFWRDNRDTNTWSDELKELVARWQTRLPNNYDFPSKTGIFHLENYLYVLYGMEFETDLTGQLARYSMPTQAKQKVDWLQQQAKELAQQLLPHRELIRRIHQYGLQKN